MERLRAGAVGLSAQEDAQRGGRDSDRIWWSRERVGRLSRERRVTQETRAASPSG